MNTNSYDSKILKERENYNEWAKWIYYQLQEKHPDASRIMVWEEIKPSDDIVEKRKEESISISKTCQEALDDEERKIKDPDLFKLHLLKIDRRNKLRGMVTSAIGFIQQRISNECLQLIKHTEVSYKQSIEMYDLYSFWDSILRAMMPKGMVKSMMTARILNEISNLKQGEDESINSYISNFSKKMDELTKFDGISIKQSVLSCLYTNGLNESFTSFKNHIQNLSDDDMDFVKAREASIRWATIGEINNTALASVSVKGTTIKQKAYDKKSKQNKKGCYICKETSHFFRECPKLKAIAAGATIISNNNNKINEKYDAEENNSQHST